MQSPAIATKGAMTTQNHCFYIRNTERWGSYSI